MNYCPEPDSHIINKIKLERDSPNYATISDLEKQQVLMHQNILKGLVQLVNELDIGESETNPFCVNNFKTNVNKLDITELQIISVDLKKP